MSLFETTLLSAEVSLIENKWREKEIPSEVLEKSPALQIAKDAVDGKFKNILTNPLVRRLALSKEVVSLSETRNAATSLVVAYLLEPDTLPCTKVPSEAEQELVRLAAGVACLHAFVQVNWTGPNLDISPSEALSNSDEASTLSHSEEDLNRQAIASLAYGGEPAYHLAKVATFLQLARLLFDLEFKHCRSAPWWRLRAATIHQLVLDEPVSLPPAFFQSLSGTAESLGANDPDIAGRLILEEGLLHHRFANDKTAAEQFVRAAKVMGLEYELTGALGKRTKFQVTDLSQLVLLAKSRDRDGEGKEKVASDGKGPDARKASNDQTQDQTLATNSQKENHNVPETLALNDDTLLEQTQFTSSSYNSVSPHEHERLSHLDPGAQPPLHPLDQCIFLALCLNVRNTSPIHGLTTEQMSPYVARVISHPQNWSIHTMALLLRSRLEAHRTRTVERSTLQLQALIDQMPTADSSLQERLLFFHTIPLPSKWEMERELAIRFLSLGVVRSAMEIFERLEMWEEVVKCWQSMERPEKGIAIVKDLLEGTREESDVVIARGKQISNKENRMPLMDSTRAAKLWCLLGDLEPENAQDHYQKAWEVSKETSGRAMRSLGGYHFARGHFAKAVFCLRHAVAINPLLGRSWFILGCALVREEEWEGARDAFMKCVTLDDEDGESWSNLASVYLRMGEAGKAVNESGAIEDHLEDDETVTSNAIRSIPFANKMLAFRALKQGLKYSYDNWRMWSNFMIVAVDVGELAEACRALGRLVEQRAEKVGDKCVDEDVLDRLVNAVTSSSSTVAGPDTDSGMVHPQPYLSPNEGQGLYNRVSDLFAPTLLPRLSSSPRIFRAYARLLMWKSSWSAALEAHMNGYRASVVNDEKVETDLSRWREAVNEVEELVDVLRNLGPKALNDTSGTDGVTKPKGNNWQFQARGVVRTFMGRTRSEFEDEQEWIRLEELLKGLK